MGNAISGFSLILSSGKSLMEQYEAGTIDLGTALGVLSGMLAGLPMITHTWEEAKKALIAITEAQTAATAAETLSKT
ncbi:MAG: hypothetical protein IKY94_15215 [Lachnospiraceae bacterium]|nr:hypothetical protein [Lachnospiraceae bacterium]